MMKKSLRKLSISSVIAVVGVMGCWIGMPVPMLKQAISQVSSQDELAKAERLNQQAYELYQQGKYNEAIILAEQALEVRKKILGDNDLHTAGSLNNLALLYQLQGKYTEAEDLYKEALDITKAQSGDSKYTASSLNNFAFFYQSQGKYTEAENLYKEALAIFKTKLGDNHLNTAITLDNLGFVYQLQGRYTEAEDLHKQALTIFKTKLGLGDNHPNTATALNNLAGVYHSQGKYSEAEALYKRVLDIIKAQLGDNHLKTASTLNNLATVYHSQEKYSEAENLYKEALAITKAQLGDNHPNTATGFNNLAAIYESQEIYTKAETIDKAVEKLRPLLRNSNVPIKQLKREARELDKLVMQPVRQLLGDTKTILLSPDAALNLIPFEALVDENNQYLVENYQITYLTSGRDLLRLQNPSNDRQTPLVIANPRYQKQGEIVTLDAYRSIDLSERVFLPLEGTQQEAEAISQLFSEAFILTDTKATENALKQVKNPDFLHIATHGFFEPSKPSSENPTDFDNPLFRSGLVFAGVEKSKSGGDDGVLTAYEGTLLNLVGTQLVVLSACDTGIGDISAGEGIYGLRRAFVIAGSESQLISLWKVDDTATKDLMSTYYERLKAGEGRREALHQIQRDWLEGKKGEQYQHPYYWASFIPSGDWTPMEFSSTK